VSTGVSDGELPKHKEHAMRAHTFDVTLHWDDPDGFTTRCRCGWRTPPAVDEAVLAWSRLEHLIAHDVEPPVVLASVDLAAIADSLAMAAGALEADPGATTAPLQLLVGLDTLIDQLARLVRQPLPAASLPALLIVELVLVATEAAVELAADPVTADLRAHLDDVAEWLHLAWMQAADLAAA
jgi:hypothetical protein